MLRQFERSFDRNLVENSTLHFAGKNERLHFTGKTPSELLLI